MKGRDVVGLLRRSVMMVMLGRIVLVVRLRTRMVPWRLKVIWIGRWSS